MPSKHDWAVILPLAQELVRERDNWSDLASAISARIGRRLPRTTLRQGICQHLGDMDYLGFQESCMDDAEKLTPLGRALLQYLRRKGRVAPLSLMQLCDQFDRSPSSVMSAAQTLHDAGYNITVVEDQIQLPRQIMPTMNSIPMELYMDGLVHRYGVISDTHLCNRCARLDALNALYDIYEQEGIKIVLHAGNIIDGEFRYNRHELLAHGVEGQIAYLAKHYPQRDGIQTWFITGDCHEGWFAKDIGLDIGRYMESALREQGRDDFKWIGHVEADLELHPDSPQAVLRIMHPGGGSAYATSYPVQKHVEAFQEGEKPSVFIVGHYHKYDVSYPRGVVTIQPGCVEDQTSFMRKKKLKAHVGGCMIEIRMTQQGGIGRVDHTFWPFYNKGYYQDWSFRSLYENKDE